MGTGEAKELREGVEARRAGRKLADNPYEESALEDGAFMLWRRGWMSLGTSYRLGIRQC